MSADRELKPLEGSLIDRLYVDTGASTLNLRSLIASVERLSSEIALCGHTKSKIKPV
jgi:hypothetical protein